MEKILEKELSYKIYGIFIKIGKEYGSFCKEELYQKACEEELESVKIPFKNKPKILIYSVNTRNKIGFFIPDIIVDDKIIIEIKCVKTISSSAEKQLLKYLELSKYEIGYLVNFGNLYTEIIRRVYSNNRKKNYCINTNADNADKHEHSQTADIP